MYDYLVVKNIYLAAEKASHPQMASRVYRHAIWISFDTLSFEIKNSSPITNYTTRCLVIKSFHFESQCVNVIKGLSI